MILIMELHLIFLGSGTTSGGPEYGGNDLLVVRRIAQGLQTVARLSRLFACAGRRQQHNGPVCGSRQERHQELPSLHPLAIPC